MGNKLSIFFCFYRQHIDGKNIFAQLWRTFRAKLWNAAGLYVNACVRPRKCR